MKSNQSLLRHRRRLALGLSLVELMVSLALGLLLISGMLTLLARNSETRGEIEKAGRQVENGRYAVQRLSEDIHHAGYYGEFYDLPAGTSLPNPCDTTLAGLKTAMSFPIQASIAAGTPPTCIDTADFVAGTHILVVRFASPVYTLGVVGANGYDGWGAGTATSANLAGGVVYMQPYVEGVNFATLTSSPTATTLFPTYQVRGAGGTLVNAPVYRYITRLYFISPCSRPASGVHCSASADDGNPIPTLKMVELGSNGSAGNPPTYTDGTAPAFSTAPVSVAEGIERVEYDFGLDTDGDGSPDSYVNCSSCSVTDWAKVVTIRINLLARNSELSAGYSDVKVYSMGLVGNAAAPTGKLNYKRQVYQVQARLSNQSMRKEQ